MKRVLMRASTAGGDGGDQRARDAALGLLARSVRFQHARLAVLRFADAVAVGALPPPEQWEYCSGIARTTSDPALQAIFQRAVATVASSQRGSPVGVR